MKPLAGKVTMITGASAPRGIGRSIALRLAQDGAAVAITDMHGKMRLDGIEPGKSKLLAEIVAEIESGGGRAAAMEVDVTREEDINRCVKKTRQIFGGLDSLVNNAGTLSGSDYFLETKPAEWEPSFRVNLLGPMMFSQAAITEMKITSRGSIVNIGSSGSLGAVAGFGAYTAMKHGLIGMTKTIAAEFGECGIRCNAICPGYIMTDMHAAANQRLAEENNIPASEMMKLRYENVALRRPGEPNEVAAAVA